MPTSLERAAIKAEFRYTAVQLERLESGWICPLTRQVVPVEAAALSHFAADGWRGYAGEGGLILNLIKAASFLDLPLRSRATYVEAIYSQNVAFMTDRFETADLLAAVETADAERIKRNFAILTSTTPAVIEEDGFVLSSRTTSMLDFFPGLEAWMFDELFAVAGVGLLHKIARIFAVNPYEYRRGWPDLTIWRGREIRFVEIKAPGDKLQASQRRLVTDLGKPAGLDFWIAEVMPT